MRKNGFTLIELLAVIVILAIIALIATPIILGIINDAREKANERSVELYASAVRNAVAAYQLTGTKSPTSFDDLDIQYDGEVVCTTEELYEDGSFYLDGCKVNNGEKEYSYGTKQGSEVAKLCTANTEKATALVWQGNAAPNEETAYEWEEVGLLASLDGAYTTGVAYTCNFGKTEDSKNLTFFVLSSTETDVTLIAGFNLGSTVAWCGDETLCKTNGEWDNTKGPITSNAAIADRTSNWSIKNGGKLTDTQMETIKLPTLDQIENANKGATTKWFCSYTKSPIAYGYWMSTYYDEDPEPVWIIYSTTQVGLGGMHSASDYGIRPVITLSKTEIG